MGHLLPPLPTDPRWYEPIMGLADLEFILGMNHRLAKLWVHGHTRTILGTTVVIHEPVVKADLDGLGMDVELPLPAVATLSVMHRLTSDGVAPDALTEVVLDLDERHGRPVLASAAARLVLPAALAEAADRLGEPSLTASLRPHGQGWVAGPTLDEALSLMAHDDQGWITSMELAELDGISLMVGRDGRHVLGEDLSAASVRLFRQGWSLDALASVLARSVEDVEHDLRRVI